MVFATFLDPFAARSAVRVFWGVRHFGRNTHFAESYVTREDRIPFTNSLLHRAHNVDLTPILPDRQDPPDDYAHMWPITFYTDSGTDAAAGRGLAPAVLLSRTADAERTARELRDRYPSGGVTVP